MEPFSARAVRAAYDVAAADYAVAFGDDLTRLRVDCAMLDAAFDTLPAGGRALDLGCGPGAVSSYLSERGAVVAGADLSAGMLGAARARDPGLRLVQADMRRLPFAAGSFDLVVAYYSLQHVPRAELGDVLDEIGRVLAGGGVLLLATHLGEGDLYMREFLGHEIEPVGGALYGRAELLDRILAAGFAVEAEEQREPLSHEHNSQRIYLLARRCP
jgi:SAM-dependent methyltransferase